MEENFEKLGQIIDGLDNLASGLNLPLPNEMHLDNLKVILPRMVEELKQLFVEMSGEDPWD